MFEFEPATPQTWNEDFTTVLLNHSINYNYIYIYIKLSVKLNSNITWNKSFVFSDRFRINIFDFFMID